MQLGTIHVLLVEDEAAHAELIQLSFEARDDIRLEIASSLADARDRLARTPPDMVIVDSLLPDGKGLELIRELRRESHYPIVLLTSHADESMQADAVAAGASGYVVKTEVTLLDMPQIVDRELDRGDAPSS